MKDLIDSYTKRSRHKPRHIIFDRLANTASPDILDVKKVKNYVKNCTYILLLNHRAPWLNKMAEGLHFIPQIVEDIRETTGNSLVLKIWIGFRIFQYLFFQYFDSFLIILGGKIDLLPNNNKLKGLSVIRNIFKSL